MRAINCYAQLRLPRETRPYIMQGQRLRQTNIIYCLDFFWNQSFISKNTHFEMSIRTQIGFSSNLMASGTVQQLDKSSWPSQIPIVCHLGKGSPMPETHIAPNHTPTIADFVPKWLNTPTLSTVLLGHYNVQQCQKEAESPL